MHRVPGEYPGRLYYVEWEESSATYCEYPGSMHPQQIVYEVSLAWIPVGSTALDFE